MIFPSGQDAVISVNGVFPESGSKKVFLETVIISDTKFFVKPGGPGGPRGPGGRASRLSAMIAPLPAYTVAKILELDTKIHMTSTITNEFLILNRITV